MRFYDEPKRVLVLLKLGGDSTKDEDFNYIFVDHISIIRFYSDCGTHYVEIVMDNGRILCTEMEKNKFLDMLEGDYDEQKL